MAAGTAQTTRFFLGAATVMLGTQAAALDLLPSTHSIGLVKNVTISNDPNWVDLTQGTKNTLVYQLLTQNSVKFGMEVYEYTAKNLTYGLSLDGTGIAPYSVQTTVVGAIDGSPTPAATITVASFTGFADNDTILIQEPGSEDQILARKIVSHSGAVITLDVTIKADFSAGAIVTKVNTVDLGSTTANPFLSAKIAGLLPDGTPLMVILPKVRIVKGFSMAFQTQDFQNMPFELEALDLVPTDTFYSTFPTRKGVIYTP